MKLNFKVVFSKEKNKIPLLKEDATRCGCPADGTQCLSSNASKTVFRVGQNLEKP